MCRFWSPGGWIWLGLGLTARLAVCPRPIPSQTATEVFDLHLSLGPLPCTAEPSCSALLFHCNESEPDVVGSPDSLVVAERWSEEVLGVG